MIRTQINKYLKIKERIEIRSGLKAKKKLKKRIGRSIQEKRSMPYSAKKINEKKAPPYSVLNPETSSDSDSLKSKGARWVSAKVQINQIVKKIRKLGED